MKVEAIALVAQLFSFCQVMLHVFNSWQDASSSAMI